MTPTNELNERFENLAITAIAESKFNPRKTFDPKAMEDLTASVASKGVIEPIVVRPHPKPKAPVTHEVVVGSRRFRASIAAKLTTIPAMIRDYTDDQVLEIQIIENLQREDPHPLEEADGFAFLLKRPGYTAEVISEKIGHGVDYVYKRISLTALIKELREDFLASHINIGHAMLLAPLPADRQEYARDEFLYAGGGNQRVGNEWIILPEAAIPVAHLKIAIQSQIFLSLEKAPWKKDDATLVPKAGACNVCPKRTGANAVLFDQMDKGDMCLDGACYQSKSHTHLIQIEKERKAEGKPVVRISSRQSYYVRQEKIDGLAKDDYTLINDKTKKCEKMTDAIFVDGPQKAQLVRICKDKNCKIHHGVSGSSGSFGSGAREDYWEARAIKLEANIKTATRRAIVEDILESTFKVDKGPYAAADWGYHFTHGQAQVLALALLGNGVPPELLNALKTPSMSTAGKMRTDEVSKELEKMIRAAKGSPAASELPRIVIALALQDYVKEFAPYNDDRLDLAAAAFGVNQKQIATEIGTSLRATFQAKRKKAEANKAKKQDAGDRKADKENAAKKAAAKPVNSKPTPKPAKKAPAPKKGAKKPATKKK